MTTVLDHMTKGLKLLFGTEETTQELERMLAQVKQSANKQGLKMSPANLRRGSTVGGMGASSSPGAPKKQAHPGLAGVTYSPGPVDRKECLSTTTMARPNLSPAMVSSSSSGLDRVSKGEGSGPLIGPGSVAAAAGLGIRSATLAGGKGYGTRNATPGTMIGGNKGGAYSGDKIREGPIKREDRPGSHSTVVPAGRMTREGKTRPLRRKRPSIVKTDSEDSNEEDTSGEEEDDNMQLDADEPTGEMWANPQETGRKEMEEAGQKELVDDSDSDGPQPYDACHVCKEDHSADGNCIVICEKCFLGFHQKCCKPEITESVIKSPKKWFCKNCQTKRDLRRETRSKRISTVGALSSDSDNEPLVSKGVKRDSDSSGEGSDSDRPLKTKSLAQ
eukprot:Ihof_evm1s262 gene=Ihof_evmTU1s262